MESNPKQLMSLLDAWEVAKTVAQCCDPPVTHGIFGRLSTEFPHLRFHYVDFDTIRVEDVSKGVTVYMEGRWDEGETAPADAVD